ncbi:MAG: hypothetical protein JOZ32_03965 [Bryobacterales bacterium]|nr:hypothetical protein [Bryobacterales bacterium]
MSTLSQCSALLLCVCLPVVSFGQQDGYKVIYRAGSVPGFHPGDELKFLINSKGIRFSKEEKKDVLLIPVASVDELSYGNNVVRRVKAAAATDKEPLGGSRPATSAKSSESQIGILWVDGDRKGALAMECDKGDYAAVLAQLERATGKKAIASNAAVVKR